MERLRLLFLVLCCSRLLSGTHDVRIANCDNTRRIVAEEGKELKIECLLPPYRPPSNWIVVGLQPQSTTTRTMKWTIENWMGEKTIHVTCTGSRDGFTCEDALDRSGTAMDKPLGLEFSQWRVLTIRDVDRKALNGSTVTCTDMATMRNESCPIDVIYPSDTARCFYNVVRQNWTLAGHCDVSKVYSSAGYYGVLLNVLYDHIEQQQYWNRTESSTLTSSTDLKSGLLYYKGRFSFSLALPSDSKGTITFSLIVKPCTRGRDLTSRNNIDIRPATQPKLENCGNFRDIYIEGEISRRLGCSCKVMSLGMPAGRLMWIAGDSEVLLSGEYGDSVLRFPSEKLTRKHNGLPVTCQVDWIKKTNSSIFPLNVAYGPDGADISLLLPVNLDGNHPVTLLCTPSGDVNPPDALVTRWSGLCRGRRSSTCTLNPPQLARADGGPVTCTLNNSRIPTRTVRKTWILTLSPGKQTTSSDQSFWMDFAISCCVVLCVTVFLVLIVLIAAWRLHLLPTCHFQLPSPALAKASQQPKQPLHQCSELNGYMSMSSTALLRPQPPPAEQVVTRQISEDIYVNDL